MEKDTKIAITFLIVFAVLVFTAAYYWSNKYDSNCFNKIGERYCSDNNYSQYVNMQDYAGRVDFRCYNEIGNVREGIIREGKDFYFLESEQEGCQTKKRWSFKKLTLLTGNPGGKDE